MSGDRSAQRGLHWERESNGSWFCLPRIGRTILSTFASRKSSCCVSGVVGTCTHNLADPSIALSSCKESALTNPNLDTADLMGENGPTIATCYRERARQDNLLLSSLPPIATFKPSRQHHLHESLRGLLRALSTCRRNSLTIRA